MALKLA
jgi:hypothetical protein